VVRLKRTTGLIEVFVAFPVAVFVAIAIALAVSVEGLVIYVGTLLSVWLMFAYALPLLTGVISPGEVQDNIRARRRHGSHYEGEPLGVGSTLWRVRTKELD
jgi:hypothetical protein